MFKKEIDFDEELERIARKSNINIQRTEYSYDKILEKLDVEMDNILDDKIKAFDENKSIAQDYLNIENDTSFVDRYREKLKKI